MKLTYKNLKFVNNIQNSDEINKKIVLYYNFPKPESYFIDICPILNDLNTLKLAVELFIKCIKNKFPNITHLLAIESRGFMFASSVAIELGIGFIPIRKFGKLPGECYTMEYTYEYGQNCLQLQKNVIDANSKIVILDDIFASGGTVKSSIDLVKIATEKLPLGVVVLIEILPLNGRKIIECELCSIIDLLI